MKEFAFYISTVIATVFHSHIIVAEVFVPEDARTDFFGLAKKHGHSPEHYDVVTEDDYILSLFRLPGSSKIPVLLMHGILDTADTFLLRGNSSIAITLVNSGYDVWLGNCRGNRYSRRHRALDPSKDSIYWDFSFHEMGYYDLPAFIFRVLKETGAPALNAIGHSQGNTIFYVLGSTRPEYNSKINVMMALAPVCYLHNSTTPVLKIILNMLSLLNNILRDLNIQFKEIFGYDSVAAKLFRTICNQPEIGYHLCMSAGFFHVIGYDPEEFEPEFFKMFTFYHPAGTSWRDVLHFIQIEKNKKFQRFDLGSDQNVKMYNSTIPPLYELSKVTMPVVLLAAKNDPLSTLANVDSLRRQLRNVASYIIIPRLTFNHGDHVWGRHVNSIPYILSVLTKFN